MRGETKSRGFTDTQTFGQRPTGCRRLWADLRRDDLYFDVDCQVNTTPSFLCGSGLMVQTEGPIEGRPLPIIWVRNVMLTVNAEER